MEDEVLLAPPHLAAVFDGHGGKAVSKYARLNLHGHLCRLLPKLIAERQSIDKSSHATVHDCERAIQLALAEIDKQVLSINHWSYQGSTAVVLYIHEARSVDTAVDSNINTNSPETTYRQSATEDSITRTLILANIGDSRAILSRQGHVIELTHDHKPDDPVEYERILSMGGSVVWHGDVDRSGNPIEGTGVYRVNGNLALSRALGDASEKPIVTAGPDLTRIEIIEGVDDFVVLATDGLWDVMYSEDVVGYVHALLEAGEDIAIDDIPGMLVEEALRRGSCDNITVLIVWLRAFESL
jgi:serine/threonine protein phosphatase PrpC